MHLSGQLSDWSIQDLLQIMQVTKKTGSLDIEGDRRGRVHFRDGAVTGAELTGPSGSYVGDDRSAVADILYVLATLESGSFSVGPADGPDATGWSVEDLTTDIDALRALEGEVVDAGLFEASGVGLATDIDAPLTLDPVDWAVLVRLVESFTFPELETRFGRGMAVRILHTLHRLGVVEVQAGEGSGIGTETEIETDLTGDEESGWLDRLADEISPEAEKSQWVEEETEQVEEPAAAEPAGAEPALDGHHGHGENVRGVSAPASTTLTDGVYDEIRRLRSKVAEK